MTRDLDTESTKLKTFLRTNSIICICQHARFNNGFFKAVSIKTQTPSGEPVLTLVVSKHIARLAMLHALTYIIYVFLRPIFQRRHIYVFPNSRFGIAKSLVPVMSLSDTMNGKRFTLQWLTRNYSWFCLSECKVSGVLRSKVSQISLAS